MVIWTLLSFFFHLGADIHWTDDYPFHRALEENHTDVVKFLVEKFLEENADDYKLLLKGVEYVNDVEVVEFFLNTLDKQGADVQSFISEAFPLASRGKHNKILRYLLSIGADPHYNNDKAIKLAIKHARVKSAEFLLDNVKYDGRLLEELIGVVERVLETIINDSVRLELHIIIYLLQNAQR